MIVATADELAFMRCVSLQLDKAPKSPMSSFASRTTSSSSSSSSADSAQDSSSSQESSSQESIGCSSQHSPGSFSSFSCQESTSPSRQNYPLQTTNAPDPVYTDDDNVFYNLLAKERAEMGWRALACELSPAERPEARALASHLRHSLLSWMLKICEFQACQDEIFPLASMILDKFLLFRPASPTNNKQMDRDQEEEEEEFLCCNEEELRQRQLCLLAASSLLLATKLRQTPRLSIQSLIESSRSELPFELSREEILDGELLILATLKWDLAGLVAPNDFLGVLLRKCRHLTGEIKIERTIMRENNDTCPPPRKKSNQQDRCDELRVRRHTQMLLELCLMDSKLSQYAPSVLAMTSMAVAVDGLSTAKKTGLRLIDFVKQIHESTDKVNELKQMIDVAFQIERYVQRLLNYTTLND